MKRNEAPFAWALVGPTVLTMAAILAFPLLYSLVVSFNRIDFSKIPAGLEWRGLQNYASILAKSDTWRSIGFTLYYTALSVSGEFAVGLVLALLLHRLRRGRGIFTAILILPMMMTPAVTGLIWRMMLDPRNGMVNKLLGLGYLPWLGEPRYAIVAVVVATIWQNAPFVMVLLLAGLKSLPNEPFEAARIDGAGAWQRFRYLTLPLLMPSIMVALLMRTMFEFRGFDLIWIMTEGGPAGSTETLSIMNSRLSFQFFDIGSGAALSWIMLFITGLICSGYIYTLNRSQAESIRRG